MFIVNPNALTKAVNAFLLFNRYLKRPAKT
jgi:hypothetical protein